MLIESRTPTLRGSLLALVERDSRSLGEWDLARRGPPGDPTGLGDDLVALAGVGTIVMLSLWGCEAVGVAPCHPGC